MKSLDCSVLILGGLLSLTAFSGYVLSSSYVNADNDTSVDNISITVEESCTLSGTGMNSHTATISPGTYSGASGSEYENGIGTTTLKAYCNDTSGFAIYAIGYTGEQYTGENHTKLVGTSNSSNTIATGTATGSNASDPSNWSMKLGTVSNPTPTYPITIDNSFNNYHVVPDTYTKVAHRDSGTDVGTSAEGSTLTTTYAAYISGTQAADTYEGKVKYTLVHPSSEEPAQPRVSAANRICYYANASTAVGTMGCQIIPSSGTSNYVSPTSAVLLASNFSRVGYGFAGWSDSFDYATNQNAKFYGPQEYITFTEGQYSSTNEGLSLYAVWVKSAGSLQDTTKVAELCGTGTGSLIQAPANGTANLSSVSALTDQRDNETYAIAKLADGKCWMIENLRLESTNSDNSTGTLAQGYGTSATYGNFSGLADPETANFGATDPPVANTLYSPTTDGDKIVIGDSNYPYSRMPRYNIYNNQATSTNRPQDPTTNSASNSTTNAGMYSYGNYYTWAAAIANTNHYGGPTATDADGKTSETVKTSLCPKGWQLPYGRNTGNGATIGSFSYLDTRLGGTGANQSTTEASNRWRNYPNNFIYSGYFDGSSVGGSRGDRGVYWTSTAYSSGQAYILEVYRTNIYPGTDRYGKYRGYSIRCVASGS